VQTRVSWVTINVGRLVCYNNSAFPGPLASVALDRMSEIISLATRVCLRLGLGVEFVQAASDRPFPPGGARRRQPGAQPGDARGAGRNHQQRNRFVEGWEVP